MASSPILQSTVGPERYDSIDSSLESVVRSGTHTQTHSSKAGMTHVDMILFILLKKERECH
jgi:hypothetical protein